MSQLLLTRREAVAAIAAVISALGCARRDSGGPVAIAWGRDECAWCRMTVDDPRLAAEWIAPGEAPRIFGEPGCLLSWLVGRESNAGTAWVRVPEDDAWHRSELVVFARGWTATPMSFNLTAHRSIPAASGDVTIMTWHNLLKQGAPDARPS